MSTTRADRTAIRRTSLSRPVALALDDGLVHQERTFFDYGCGRGDDLLRLHKLGIPVSGWDPAFFPDEERTPADIVNLGYVVNVIEGPDERIVVLAAAWELARKVLIVSARLDWDAADAAVDFQGDGIVTGKRTFQKFFTQEELRQWIEQALDRRPVAAAPGIFYVFRDEADAQSFAVNRVSRQRRIPGIEKSQALVADHKELIEPLMAFVTQRGRLPVDGELSAAPQLTHVFGSIARAFSLLRRVTSAVAGIAFGRNGGPTSSCTWLSRRSRSDPGSVRCQRNCDTTSAPSSGRTSRGAQRQTPSSSPPATRMPWIVRAVTPPSASSCPTPSTSTTPRSNICRPCCGSTKGVGGNSPEP